MKTITTMALLTVLGFGAAVQSSPVEPGTGAGIKVRPVTGERIIGADEEPGNWLTHGRTYSEQRFSPLDQINDRNVKDLGLAWHFDFDTNRGLEGTPLVI